MGIPQRDGKFLHQIRTLLAVFGRAERGQQSLFHYAVLSIDAIRRFSGYRGDMSGSVAFHLECEHRALKLG
jgi:hypothetical protein